MPQGHLWPGHARTFNTQNRPTVETSGMVSSDFSLIMIADPDPVDPQKIIISVQDAGWGKKK